VWAFGTTGPQKWEGGRVVSIRTVAKKKSKEATACQSLSMLGQNPMNGQGGGTHGKGRCAGAEANGRGEPNWRSQGTKKKKRMFRAAKMPGKSTQKSPKMQNKSTKTAKS